jgi:hypothetical protein
MHEMALKRVVLELAGMDAVPVRSVDYAAGRTMEVHGGGGGAPALLFVNGFPDPAFAARMGCALKDMRCYRDWARLVAVSGMAAVTYQNHEPADAELALAYLREEGAALGIDPDRIGVIAFSGNGPTAAGLVDARIRCALFVYAFLYDAAAVAQAIGFADGVAGRTPEDFPPSVPVLVVRCGRDEVPGINATIDAFIAAGLARNLPLTAVNLPNAPHAFDLHVDTPVSHDAIRQILAFARQHLV